jgi:hypothetical protein
VRVVARGWGRLALGPPFDDHRWAGDVDSLFVEGRLLQRHLMLRLGRQLAAGGAMRATQIDGLTVEGVVTQGIGLQAWAGMPVQPRFDQGRGDFITGGRLFWRHAFDSEIGASYVWALRHGYVARNDFALDGSWTPIRPVTVSAVAQWSLEEQRFAEGRLQGLWQLNPKLQIVADVARTAPDLFIDRSSIFAVFSEEFRNQAGGEVVYKLLPPLSLEAQLHWVNVEGGSGSNGGLRGTWRVPNGGTYGAELRYVTEPDNGYTLARVFGIRRLPRSLTVTVDLEAYWLQKSIWTTEKKSFLGTLTGGWGITPAWDFTVAGSLGATPNFDTRAQLIARLVYKFGLPTGLPGGIQ